MTLRSCLLLAFAMLTPCLMGMSRKTQFTISFHLQATGDEPPKMRVPMTIEGREMYFRLIPEISHENISGFYPFPSEDGTSKGLAIRLDAHGRNQLDILSHAEDGQYLVAVVNGKPVDYMVLDKWVTDGVITIWKGVPDDVIKWMEKKYPRLKPGTSALSMSKSIQMEPTTRKEKADALRESQARDAMEAAKLKKGYVEPPMTKLEVPSATGGTPRAQIAVPPPPQAPGESGAAPTTSRIPLEGARPAPASPPMSDPNGTPLPRQ